MRIVKVRQENLFRLTKSLAGYCRAVVFREMAASELDRSNSLLAASTIYYSVFHLAGAAIYSDHGIFFDSQTNVISPMGTNLSATSPRRYLSQNHRGLIRLLRENAKRDSYFGDLAAALDALIDLRELSHYGPYLQMTGATKIEAAGITAFLRPISLKEHARIDSTHPSPFETTEQKIGRLAANSTSLLDLFADFFSRRSKEYDIVEIRSMFAQLPEILVTFVVPTIPRDAYEGALSKLRSFIGKVDPISVSYFDWGKAAFYDKMIPMIKEGQIPAEVRFTIQDKPTSTN